MHFPLPLSITGGYILYILPLQSTPNSPSHPEKLPSSDPQLDTLFWHSILVYISFGSIEVCIAFWDSIRHSFWHSIILPGNLAVWRCITWGGSRKDLRWVLCTECRGAYWYSILAWVCVLSPWDKQTIIQYYIIMNMYINIYIYTYIYTYTYTCNYTVHVSTYTCNMKWWYV